MLIKKLFSFFFFFLSAIQIWAQDSLLIFRGEVPSHNHAMIKCIGKTPYCMNYNMRSSSVYQFKVFYFDDRLHKFDSLDINGSDAELRNAFIFDYYLEPRHLYILARKKLFKIDIFSGKTIQKWPLKNEMNKILNISENRIFMGEIFLFNPNDEKYSLALSYVDVETNIHNVKALHYSSIALLAASPGNISMKGNRIYVSHLDEYVIDIFDENLDNIGSITDSMTFSGLNSYNYGEKLMLHDKKDLFYRIISDDDYSHYRMLGINAISEDTLVVLYKFYSQKDSLQKHIPVIDLWVKTSKSWKIIEKSRTVSDGIKPYGVRKSNFLQFKNEFIDAHSFARIQVICQKRTEWCTEYSTYFYPNESFMWK